MTTNSPNPVDGGVQAHQKPCAWIIETPDNGVRYVELKKDLADRVAQGCAKEGIRVVITPLFTTPPAQLLRPVELPEETPNALVALCQQMYDHKSTGTTVAHDVWQDCLDELRLNATAQPVSDVCNVPDRMALLPLALTAENGAKNALIGEFKEEKSISCPECFGDEDCETCDGSGRIHIEIPVSWTTIKAIWAKGVEHFLAAAPGDQDEQ